MDLKATLAKNKAKVRGTKSTRKPVYIARDDRPYPTAENIADDDRSSIPEIMPTALSEIAPLAVFDEKEIGRNVVTDPQQCEELISNPLVTHNGSIGNPLVTAISNPLVTNEEPISNQEINADDHELHNKEPISNPISNQNGGVISNSLVTPLVTNESDNPDVSKLSGIQKKILFCIVDDCVYRGQLVSGFITNETFRLHAKANANTVKTAVQRLINKGFMQRNPDKKGKRGNGGFSSFKITEQVRDRVLHENRISPISNPLVTPLVTTMSTPLVTHKGTNKEPSAPSSSSSLKDLKTTTELDEMWQFDIAPYAKFGFYNSHLKQLAPLGVISANDVEQSLVEFDHDMQNNTLPPIKTNKINFLMGLLRAGHAYVSETYRNAQDATIMEMARRAEAKSKERLEAKFALWLGDLSEEKREQIRNKFPPYLMSLYDAHGINNADIRNWLLDYYLNNITH